MSGFEVAGISLAVAGLLVSVKGAIDGLNMLADACERDNGLRFAATQYHVEKVKLEVWARHFRVYDVDVDDENDDDDDNKVGGGGGGECLLLKQPRITRDAIWRIVAEINATHELAVEYIARYHVEPVVATTAATIAGADAGASLPPPPQQQHTAVTRTATAAVGRGAGPETFHRRSKWVALLAEARAQIPQTHRLRWAARDRDKFGELIARLATLNQNLWDVVVVAAPEELRVDTLGIVTGVLSGLSDQLSLASLLQQTSPPPPSSSSSSLGRGSDGTASLLALAARLKKMQGETVSELAAKVKHIHASELRLWDALSNDTSKRCSGTYTSQTTPGSSGNSLPEPVWIEWKAVESVSSGGSTTSPSSTMDDIILRVHALGALLSTDNAAAFYRPACLGVYDDVDYRDRHRSRSRRIGFVYRNSSSAASSSLLPVSLADLLRAAGRARTRPPLGARFELAYKLASAVSLLHATDWIHKSLRSDNILFTPPSPLSSGHGAAAGADAGVDVDITVPQIAGFQYSRPAGDASLEGRPTGVPELDYYYHPEVVIAVPVSSSSSSGSYGSGGSGGAGGWTKARELYSLGVVLLEVAHWRPAFEARYRAMTMGEVSAAMLADVRGKFGDDLAGMVGRTFVDVVERCLTGSFGVPDGLSAADEARALGDAFFQRVVRPLAMLKA
ncbi:prion-inhibition and propagation domain-containing protein [Purpureocillium lilacinum]|uniref:Prion-inhibition and propagation domain-containing protein n=1 Tax=Purpureocillium lilacinum TaxID=33203 RepID=A0A179HHW5_PURLI|nr:prion-inhibition and propagation domain-containing protein [Purpureocillium lilacinum]OAQ89060.1 prion-inhibition and propagation domain-containing protein [Purpureocillium lilacinum]